MPAGDTCCRLHASCVVEDTGSVTHRVTMTAMMVCGTHQYCTALSVCTLDRCGCRWYSWSRRVLCCPSKSTLLSTARCYGLLHIGLDTYRGAYLHTADVSFCLGGCQPSGVAVNRQHIVFNEGFCARFILLYPVGFTRCVSQVFLTTPQQAVMAHCLLPCCWCSRRHLVMHHRMTDPGGHLFVCAALFCCL